jgi:FkbM family methyltransferase
MNKIKSFLKEAGIYYRLRNSLLCEAYWRMTQSELLKRRKKEIDFYSSVLNGFRPGHVVMDVGANVGDKVDIFLRMGAKVLAVEPDLGSQRILKERYQKLRITSKPLFVIGKAVASKEGVETMWIMEDGWALNTLNPKWVEVLHTDKSRGWSDREFRFRREVETTTLDNLVDTYGVPFFIKIDVEGYEEAAIRGLSRVVPFLSFEANLPQFRSEALECAKILAGIANHGKFNYSSDCEKGLDLNEWVGLAELANAVHRTESRCVEIFWKTV